MEEKRIKAAMAGLLHDIGKLAQRASDAPSFRPEDTQREGQPVHASFSIRQIEKDILKNFDQYRAYALPGAYHHKPAAYIGEDTALVWAVALADKLSAGERSDDDRNSTDNAPQQLLTIFDSITFEKEPRTEKHYLPLRKLALEENTLFPVQAEEKKDQKAAYYQLLESVQAQFQTIARDDAEAALEQMLSILQQHTWCVPSAYYYSRPDISLYDHSRMTAALTVCLSEIEEAALREAHEAVVQMFIAKENKKGLTEETRRALDRPAAMLIGGDISGIQDFIYTIGTQKAAKTLRGRSFYLQLLTEAVLRFVLKELDLPYTNVIYSGGGHFYLLAPLSAADQLPALRRKVAEKLHKAHGIQLYLAVDGTAVPFSGFQRGQFPAHWSEMHSKLTAAKSRRYTELGDDFYKTIFTVQPHGGNAEHTCRVCGVESEQGVEESGTEDEQKIYVCSLCSSFDTEIGAKLPNHAYIALGLIEPQPLGETPTASGLLRSFGMDVHFVKSGETVPAMPEAKRVVLWALDDPWDGKYPQARDCAVIPWLRYSVTQVPEMDFDHLQDQSVGMKRLGVLRMDVDNLGNIFKDGFGKGEQSRATLSRVATLSMQMSLFFEGWLKRVIAANDFCDKHGKPLIYAVYTGGDDLFLIGPWHLMPTLAHEITSSFGRYTGSNPNLHISGGLAFIHGKYPVKSAAEDAGDEESRAKSMEGKDAFAFLGGVWHWKDFDTLTSQQKGLVQIVQSEDGGLDGSSSLLQLLQRLDEMQTNAAKKRADKKAVWGPWMWMGDYQLFRMIDRAKSKPNLQAALTKLRDELHRSEPHYGNLHDWAKAARWAQLLVRKKNDE